MDSLQISSGEIRLAVNGDPTRVVRFNPTDASFAERFYKLVEEFQTKGREYQARYQVLVDTTALDDDGVPENMKDQLDLLVETCTFIRGQIDYVFGPGTSQAAFGDSLVLEQFDEFFTGITPYVRSARSEKVEKYLKKDIAPAVKKSRKRK